VPRAIASRSGPSGPVTQALGVIHILVSGKATKYRLSEQPGQCMPTVLASACVGQHITRHHGQADCVVEFAIGEQPSIGGHHGTAKLEHQAAVRRLTPPQKGRDILLEALARQRWAGRNWHLTLYGDGSYREGLERLIRRLNLSHRVTLAGHVAAEQIWLENHVLVMPSRFEGMPLTIIEAMLCGRPVVATNVAGHSEVIVDGITGFMAEAATAQSLDMALERMWAHRDGLDKMGKAAAASVHKFAPVDPVGVFTEKIKKLADLASATR
jgi:Glycosyl transferases group 1